MLLPSVFAVLSTLTAVLAVWETGAPCQAQFTLKPLGSNSGVTTLDPPYQFSIRNTRGESVKSYAPKTIYTLRLSSSVHFRAFIIQARLATKDRFVIGHLRAGQFLPASAWNTTGVQIQNCPPINDNSITNLNNEKKYFIEANWTTNVNLGPVQFFLTVMQEEDVFWAKWKPENGFLLPDKTADFDRVKSIEQPPPSWNDNEDFAGAHRLVVPEGIPDLPATPDGADTPSGGRSTTLKLQVFNEAGKVESAVDSTTPLPFNAQAFEGSGEGSGSESENFDDIFSQKTANAAFPGLSEASEPLDATTDFDPEDQFIIAHPSQTQNAGVDGDNPDSPSPPKGAPRPSATGVKEKQTATTTKTTITTATATTTTEEAPLTRKSVVEELDPQTGRFVKFQKVVADYCAENPCKNGGTCQVDIENDDFFCDCAEGFTGETCDEVDHCLNNKCKNNGICKNEAGSYTCQCSGEWAGEFCERHCPSYLCENGGKCILTNNGFSYGCDCVPGWAGPKCAHEVNECASNPCLNGICVDKFNAYECQCNAGYMGEDCNRPCQDVYKSCARWKQEDRCQTMRPVTRFFDVNCAVTCEQCTRVNATVKTEKTLPPVLEPFTFLIGRWVSNSSTHHHYPVDFDTTTTGYEETWDITVNEVPMFGTPSINFTSRAVSNDNADDEQVIVGFLTLDARHQKDRPYDVALLSTGNDGITFVEEGQLIDREVMFKIRYHKAFPLLARNVPLSESTERIIKLSGQQLLETVKKQGQAGATTSYTKYYTRIEKYVPY